MTRNELEAYRRRKTDLFAKLSQARSNITRLNEESKRLLVRVGKGDRTVKCDDVKERGARGFVPRDIPADMYPHRSKRRRYVDTHAKTVTTRRLGVRPDPPKPLVLSGIRASDIRSSAGRGEKSERIMKDALKDYSNRPVADGPNYYQQLAMRFGIGESAQ